MQVEPAPGASVATVPLAGRRRLVLWTDGLTSRIDLAATRPVAHDPAVTAAVLHRDHTADRDDATVVVALRPGRAMTGHGPPSTVLGPG